MHLASPATIVVGEVVRLRERLLGLVETTGQVPLLMRSRPVGVIAVNVVFGEASGQVQKER